MKEIDKVMEAHGSWPGTFTSKALGQAAATVIAETVVH